MADVSLYTYIVFVCLFLQCCKRDPKTLIQSCLTGKEDFFITLSTLCPRYDLLQAGGR